MKKLIAISAITLGLMSCGFSATAETNNNDVVIEKQGTSFIDFLIQRNDEMTLLEQQVKDAQEAQIRELRVFLALQELNTHVGKTWYVFSGSTPAGWDCSGLVLWFYKHFDVELYHSATAQKFAGEIVTEPMIGDVVAFSKHGNIKASHNGIYIGNGEMIHSAQKGTVTNIRSISDFAGDTYDITYTRIKH